MKKKTIVTIFASILVGGGALLLASGLLYQLVVAVQGLRQLSVFLTKLSPEELTAMMFNLCCLTMMGAYTIRNRWDRKPPDISIWNCFRFWRKKTTAPFSRKHRHSEII